MIRSIKCPICGDRAYLGSNTISCKCGYSFFAKKLAALCPICGKKAARSALNGIITTVCFSCGYAVHKHVISKGRIKHKG